MQLVASTTAVIMLRGISCQFCSCTTEAVHWLRAQEKLHWHPTHQTCLEGISSPSPRVGPFADRERHTPSLSKERKKLHIWKVIFLWSFIFCIPCSVEIMINIENVCLHSCKLFSFMFPSLSYLPHTTTLTSFNERPKTYTSKHKHFAVVIIAHNIWMRHMSKILEFDAV